MEITSMTTEELWKVVLEEMEVRVSRTHFATWLANSRLIEKTEESVAVGLPNNFAREWVETKYRKDILGIMRNMDSSVKQVRFMVVRDPETLVATQAVPQKSAPRRMQLDLKVDPTTGLNARYTVESFVVGGSNELAHAGAMAVVEHPGVRYNPFFVYGGTGLGKTHLIQSIGNELRKQSKNAIRVQYVTSEKFTHDVVWSIRNQRTEDMRKKYRDTDVLIIDDIQFIGGKDKTEEEFFHTFNALYENNKQIIVSSDRPPHSIPTLEERLKSRFEGGLIADISFPDFETRVAIVKAKLEERGASLSEKIIEVIAKRIKRNIRELEGVLNKILFQQEKKREEMDVKTVEEIIDRSVRSLAKPVSEAQIMHAITEFYNIAAEELLGRSRRKEIVEPRQIAMYLLRDILNLSYPYIGGKLGRDHTTAIHAYEKINQEINKNSGLNQKIFQIKELLMKA
jgi:chromosomal replication initiator protein